jgi:serine/threonine protein kinase
VANYPRVEEKLQGVLNGRYRIDRMIGEGGMAIVFLAEDLQLHRKVAVKTLRGELTHDDQVVTLFSREAAKLSKLEHPNIIPLYEVSPRNSECHFFVMQYINGKTLKDLIKEGVRSVEEIVHIGVQICQALDFIHARGFIHRDIKPGNIMIDELGNAKVMDFGIAHEESGTKIFTKLDTEAGTPAYMSPEKARGEKKDDARSDIYSLGITLYEMTVGTLPFEGETTSVLYQHVHIKPPSLLSVGKGIPSWLNKVILKSIEKDPGHRFQRAQDLADALIHRQPYRGSLGRHSKVVAGVIVSLLVLSVVGRWIYPLLSDWEQKPESINKEISKIKIDFDNAKQADNLESWEEFLSMHAGSSHLFLDNARQAMRRLQIQKAFRQKEKLGTENGWRAFLENEDAPEHMLQTARVSLRTIEIEQAFGSAQELDTKKRWKAFLDHNGDAPVNMLRTARVSLRTFEIKRAFENARKTQTLKVWRAFLQEYQNCPEGFRKEAIEQIQKLTVN